MLLVTASGPDTARYRSDAVSRLMRCISCKATTHIPPGREAGWPCRLHATIRQPRHATTCRSGCWRRTLTVAPPARTGDRIIGAAPHTRSRTAQLTSRSGPPERPNGTPLQRLPYCSVLELRCARPDSVSGAGNLGDRGAHCSVCLMPSHQLQGRHPNLNRTQDAGALVGCMQ